MYEKLTPEQQEAVLREFRRTVREGMNSPKLEPSLLGLDWSEFRTRHENKDAFVLNLLNPPEFISYSFSSLDAYATALVAEENPGPWSKSLLFRCRLTKAVEGSEMYLEFNAFPDQRDIQIDWRHESACKSFIRLLPSKRIKKIDVEALGGPFCHMRMAYPGQMEADCSPFLRNRPLEDWPETSLELDPTPERIQRAKAAMHLSALQIDTEFPN